MEVLRYGLEVLGPQHVQHTKIVVNALDLFHFRRKARRKRIALYMALARLRIRKVGCEVPVGGRNVAGQQVIKSYKKGGGVSPKHGIKRAGHPGGCSRLLSRSVFGTDRAGYRVEPPQNSRLCSAPVPYVLRDLTLFWQNRKPSALR